MSTHDPARFSRPTSGPVDRVHMSLADVCALHESRRDLPPQAHRDIASAVRKVVKLLGRRPDEIPANPRYLREQLARFNAAAAGVSPGRWRNINSLLGKALAHAGVRSLPGRYVAPVGPTWLPLWCKLGERRMRSGLSRLIHWCNAASILPEMVDDQVLARFGADLQRDSLAVRPKSTHRITCQLWNRAVVEVPGWPARQLTVPCYRVPLALPWSTFPASFEADVDAFLAQSAGDNPLADGPTRPINPLTRRQRRGLLLKLATALVKSGYCAPERIDRLTALVAVPAAEAILRFLHQRAGGRKTGHIQQQATLLKSIAKHWVKVDELHLDQLRVRLRTPIGERCA